MILNNFGKLADICWQEIPLHFTDIELDEYIIMPNYIHGIIIIDYDESQDLEMENVNPKITRNENIRSLRKSNLSSVIKGFKIGVTKISKKKDLKYFKWQRSFFDRIIRDEKELINIRKYIKYNPNKWDYNNETIENINI